MLHAGLAQQHFQPDVAGFGHLFQPRRDDNAVLPDNRHHIRYRAERQQIGVTGEHSSGIALERADQLERHAHARQAAERIIAVRALAVHDGVRFGQAVVAFVVVGNHDLHTERAGCGDFLVRRNAGIDRDQQARPLAIQPLHSRARKAVAFVQTVRDIIFADRAFAAQIIHHDAGRRDTVHIIITVNDDMLVILKRAADGLDCPVHIGHQERVVQPFGVAAQITLRGLRRIDPARGKDRGGQRRAGAIVGEHAHTRLVQRGNHPMFGFHKTPSFIFDYHYYTKIIDMGQGSIQKCHKTRTKFYHPSGKLPNHFAKNLPGGAHLGCRPPPDIPLPCKTPPTVSGVFLYRFSSRCLPRSSTGFRY